MTGSIIAHLTLPPYQQATFPDPTFPVSMDFITAVAVGDWLLRGDKNDKESLRHHISEWKGRYEGQPQPYSYTQGSPLLRAIPVGLMAEDMDEARQTGRLVAEVSHPIKPCIESSEAIAATAFMASRDIEKGQIKTYIEREFGFDLSNNNILSSRKPNITFSRKITAQALRSFLYGTSFKETMKKAQYADDTHGLMTAVACGLAEVYHGIPFILRKRISKKIPDDINEIITGIQEHHRQRQKTITPVPPSPASVLKTG